MNVRATGNLRLEISRTIRAPRERVFKAFSSADELKKWFGPGECHVIEGDLDFRVGGGYRLSMFTSDMGEADLVGRFTEIVAGERIAYTWEWQNNEKMHWGQMEVTVSFRDADGGTEVSILHEGIPVAEVRDGHREGWNGSFDKLGRCYGGRGELEPNT